MRISESLSENVLFSGYYGWNNLGDDAFCAISAWGAKKYWGTHNIQILSRRALMLPVPARNALLPKQFFKGQGQLELMAKALFGRPTIVFAGGSVFYSFFKWYEYKGIIKTISKSGVIKIAAMGVSLGPFRSKKDKNCIEEFLKRMLFLTLRDKRSYDIAMNMKLPYNPILASDLAFMLPKVYGMPQVDKLNRTDQKILGVTLCHYERYAKGDRGNEERREKCILDVLIKIAKEDKLKLRFFIFNNHPTYGDVSITERFIFALKGYCSCEIVPYSNNLGDIWAKVVECKAFLSTRLHGAIFAASAEVPFMLVEYHQKCSDYLDDIAIESKYRIGDCAVSVNEIAFGLNCLLDNNMGYDMLILNKIRSSSILNFTGLGE